MRLLQRRALRIAALLMPCILLLLLLLSLKGTTAYSNGAGECEGGKAAVGGFHLDTSNSARQVITGSLTEGSVKVIIGADRLIPGSVYELSTQTDYVLEVTTDNALGGYKGILLRLGSSEGVVDLTASIQPNNDPLLHDAVLCKAPMEAGVTHTSNTQKTKVSALVRFDYPGNVNLDVTIVGVNDAKTSVYGYDGFPLQVTGAAAPARATLGPNETAVPTTAPTRNDIMGSLSPTPSAAFTRWCGGETRRAVSIAASMALLLLW